MTLLLAEGATRKSQSSCSETLSRSALLLLQTSISMLPVEILLTVNLQQHLESSSGRTAAYESKYNQLPRSVQQKQNDAFHSLSLQLVL